MQFACTDSLNFSDARVMPITVKNWDGQAMVTTEVRAEFFSMLPSNQTRRLANSILQSQDNNGKNFVILDKTHALLYVFNLEGIVLGASPVLLGAAKGDDNIPGIGLREISQIRPEERTTPAGRFIAEHGFNNVGEDIVWVDYDAAVSMHRVRASNVSERRLERLATATASDNRISYGCINVPSTFYNAVITPLFKGNAAIVYVLPDVKALEEVFNFTK
jgi:hypothetical protein